MSKMISKKMHLLIVLGMCLTCTNGAPQGTDPNLFVEQTKEKAKQLFPWYMGPGPVQLPSETSHPVTTPKSEQETSTENLAETTETSKKEKCKNEGDLMAYMLCVGNPTIENNSYDQTNSIPLTSLEESSQQVPKENTVTVRTTLKIVPSTSSPTYFNQPQPPKSFLELLKSLGNIEHKIEEQTNRLTAQFKEVENVSAPGNFSVKPLSDVLSTLMESASTLEQQMKELSKPVNNMVQPFIDDPILSKINSHFDNQLDNVIQGMIEPIKNSAIFISDKVSSQDLTSQNEVQTNSFFSRTLKNIENSDEPKEVSAVKTKWIFDSAYPLKDFDKDVELTRFEDMKSNPIKWKLSTENEGITPETVDEVANEDREQISQIKYEAEEENSNGNLEMEIEEESKTFKWMPLPEATEDQKLEAPGEDLKQEVVNHQIFPEQIKPVEDVPEQITPDKEEQKLVEAEENDVLPNNGGETPPLPINNADFGVEHEHTPLGGRVWTGPEGQPLPDPMSLFSLLRSICSALSRSLSTAATCVFRIASFRAQ